MSLEVVSTSPGSSGGMGIAETSGDLRLEPLAPHPASAAVSLEMQTWETSPNLRTWLHVESSKVQLSYKESNLEGERI